MLEIGYLGLLGGLNLRFLSLDLVILFTPFLEQTLKERSGGGKSHKVPERPFNISLLTSPTRPERQPRFWAWPWPRRSAELRPCQGQDLRILVLKPTRL